MAHFSDPCDMALFSGPTDMAQTQPWQIIHSPFSIIELWTIWAIFFLLCIQSLASLSYFEHLSIGIHLAKFNQSLQECSFVGPIIMFGFVYIWNSTWSHEPIIQFDLLSFGFYFDENDPWDTLQSSRWELVLWPKTSKTLIGPVIFSVFI